MAGRDPSIISLKFLLLLASFSQTQLSRSLPLDRAAVVLFNAAQVSNEQYDSSDSGAADWVLYGNPVLRHRRRLLQSTSFRRFSEVTAGVASTAVPGLRKGIPQEIDMGALKTVQLLAPNSKEACRGGLCSGLFQKCKGELSEVESCWNKDLAPWIDPVKEFPFFCPALKEREGLYSLLPSHCLEGRNVRQHEAVHGGYAGQVVRLHNVFVDAQGRVFNATHRFLFGGCSSAKLQGEMAQVYHTGQKAVVYKELVNLLLEPQTDAMADDFNFQEVAVKLPLFLAMAKLMPKLQKLPWAVQDRKVVRPLWKAILGVKLAIRHLHAVPTSGLLFVETLYQPLLPPCNKPSPALWRIFRARHLVPPAAPRMFDLDGVYQKPPRPHWRMGPASPDWVVVVARGGLSGPRAQQMHTAQLMLESLFTKRRVVEYYGRIPIADAKLLFERAVLLVAPRGSEMLNMVFMPFASSVLELGLPPQDDTGSISMRPETRGDIYEQLAWACGLIHYNLDCSNASSMKAADPLSPFCNVDELMAALETAQHGIFSRTNFDPASLDPAGKGFTDSVPGTVVRSEEERERVHAWHDCVGEKGQWVLEPRPRLLPWNYSGKTGSCETSFMHAGYRARRESNDVLPMPLRSVDSDAYVRSGGGPDGWNVRPSLKYKWVAPEKCGDWTAFSGPRLCKWGSTGRGGTGRTILILGDSLNEQMGRALVYNLMTMVRKPAPWAVQESVPQECTDWLPPGYTTKVNFCREYTFNVSWCRRLSVKFLRNDNLQISGNKRVFDRIPWTKSPALEHADVIVLNRGAHWYPDEHYIHGLRSTVRFLRNKFPEKLIIFRNTPPGHPNCEQYDKPLDEPLDMNKIPEAYKPYQWQEFAHQNLLAKQIVEEVGGLYLDVDAMTKYRADGHIGAREDLGKTDCLHYCMPGPLDVWVQALYNMMRQVLPI